MKRLVVCCDGTWNRRDAGERATNVAKTADAVAAADGRVRQMVFYDAGVGTGGWLDRVAGGATGRGLAKNVLDAYRFLVQHHEDGDELFLFGFSRGAYTARSVVGLVRKCGILRPEAHDRLDEAYALYRSGVHPDDARAQAFRDAFSKTVRVRFLGVWDTVGALGIPGGLFRSFNRRRHGFHDVKLSRIVDVACHALAIDERRRSFRPTLWSTTPDPRQRVQQLWFPGVHSNVGGGYATAGLADVALDWMMGEAEAAGLVFAEGARGRLSPAPSSPMANSRRGFWRLLPGAWRRIGDARHQPQAVHAAALRRMADAHTRYKPPNLVRYLRRAGGDAAVPVVLSEAPAAPDGKATRAAAKASPARSR